MNSIRMLNYLTVLSQEINSSNNSRIFLESAYSSLINNTYPNAVDVRTEAHMEDLLDTLESFRMLTVKRERIQDVTWKSSSTKIADFEKNADGSLKMDENGNVQLNCKKAGTVTITATSADGSKQKVSFKLTIVKTVTELSLADQIVISSKSLNLAKLVTINPSDATNKKLTWKITSGSAYATISSSGSFKAKKVTVPQIVVVTVTAQDVSNTATTCKITIYP